MLQYEDGFLVELELFMVVKALLLWPLSPPFLFFSGSYFSTRAKRTQKGGGGGPSFSLKEEIREN